MNVVGADDDWEEEDEEVVTLELDVVVERDWLEEELEVLAEELVETGTDEELDVERLDEEVVV